MGTTVADRVIDISGEPSEEWARMVMAASSRNMPWQDILCELIDNARSYHKAGKPTLVQIAFSKSGKSKSFECIDNGEGGTDANAFLSPGVSGGIHRHGGNSTFGTGLFAVECHLQGSMDIYTFPLSGDGMRIHRDIAKSQHGTATMIENDQDNRIQWGVPADGGTRVLFSRIRKPTPHPKTIDEIASDIGATYADAIRSGALRVVIGRNENRREVTAAPEPTLTTTNRAEVVDEHGYRFAVAWGVTKQPNTLPGVELIYGGKQFDVTALPCGDFNTKFFYGSITIPRAIGPDAMDLLKRDIDNDRMAPVYEECAKLFREALEESHRLSTTKDQEDLNTAIADLLSGENKRDDVEDGGEEDRRKFKRRENDGEGVEPKNTGRTRRGYKRRSHRGEKQQNPVNVNWQPMGERAAIATYEVASNRLTFNEDNEKAMSWRSNNKNDLHRLATIGAAFMADKLRNDTGYGDFGWQMTRFCERLQP